MFDLPCGQRLAPIVRSELERLLIRDLYHHELRLYKNFLLPVMKLVRKVSGHVKRVYDTPKTPYQRLLESGQIDERTADEFRRIYLSLNPAEIKRQMDKKLSGLFDIYEKKKKRSVMVNPYRKLEPSMVTF